MALQTEAPLDDSPPPRDRRRRLLFWSGVSLITAGVVLLGYVAWQFYGTNWVSHRKQQAIVADLQEQWAKSPAPAPAKEAKPVDLGEASAIIRIPRLGKKYAVPVLEGVGEGVLAKGYGHFEGSAQPGAIGNYALAAHRVTHGEPLRRMPDLRPGDKIIVETSTTIYTYVLDTDPNDLVIPFTETWVVDRFPRNPDDGEPTPTPANGRRLITLTTCAELFHTDNRMIAFGHLESSKVRT